MKTYRKLINVVVMVGMVASARATLASDSKPAKVRVRCEQEYCLVAKGESRPEYQGRFQATKDTDKAKAESQKGE